MNSLDNFIRPTTDIEEMHCEFGVYEAVSKLTDDQYREFFKLRLAMLTEEYNETMDAVAACDAEEVVDGMIDMLVIIFGTLDLMYVDVDRAWGEVMRANFAKRPGIKPERPNPLGLPDLVKPEGWVAPSHKGNHGDLPRALDTYDNASRQGNLF